MSVDPNLGNTDLFGKTVSDLQTGIVVSGTDIEGTLKYVADYSSAYGAGEDSGNYIALKFQTNVPATITVEVVNGVHGPVTLDDDGIAILRIADKSTQTIQVVASADGFETLTKTFSLTGLTCRES